MTRTANYALVEVSPEQVVIRDVGPHDQYLTITNAVESVVAELVSRGVLRKHQRLFYYDSENQLDEIVVSDGKFAGFKPGPRGRKLTIKPE